MDLGSKIVFASLLKTSGHMVTSIFFPFPILENLQQSKCVGVFDLNQQVISLLGRSSQLVSG